MLLGDIVGRTGCRAVYDKLGALRASLGVRLVIANGENASDGAGLDPAIYRGLRGAGVDVVTSGNHIWQNPAILPLLHTEERLLRPENYPLGVPGHGHVKLDLDGTAVAVLNLEGRRSLNALRCPFGTACDTLDSIGAQTKIIIVDFHAEAPDEKEALAFHLDGSVSGLVGTHTHVQTADERIFPGGMGYITDAGMCGSPLGVIGMDPDLSARRYVTQMPLKMVVDEREGMLCGVVLDIDPGSGACTGIERVRG